MESTWVREGGEGRWLGIKRKKYRKCREHVIHRGEHGHSEKKERASQYNIMGKCSSKCRLNCRSNNWSEEYVRVLILEHRVRVMKKGETGSSGKAGRASRGKAGRVSRGKEGRASSGKAGRASSGKAGRASSGKVPQ